MINIGQYKITSHVLESFSLDGGAMFGAIPKSLWSKRISSDELNRIPMVTRVLLLESEKRTILVDAGCGDKWSDKLKGIYGIEYLRSVTDVVDSPSDVFITHLHFDHGAGLVEKQGSLVYPKANYWIFSDHLQRARTPGVRERASYLAENINPLEEARLNYLRDGEEWAPGLKSYRSDGHTLGLGWLTVTDGKNTLAYPSDLLPTSRHTEIPWVMGYDLNAEKAMSEKEMFLKRAVEEDWLVIFEHDHDTPAGRIHLDERGRYTCRPEESFSDS